jgi:hypothetical protein
MTSVRGWIFQVKKKHRKEKKKSLNLPESDVGFIAHISYLSVFAVQYCCRTKELLIPSSSLFLSCSNIFFIGTELLFELCYYFTFNIHLTLYRLILKIFIILYFMCYVYHYFPILSL